MLNRFILMGRFVRDPELKHTQSGVPVTSFTLAVDRDFKDQQSGERATDFIDCTAWRAGAEFVCKYFGKGRMAVVEGRLQIREWKDKDGNNRRSAEVVADSVYFADSKKIEGNPVNATTNYDPSWATNLNGQNGFKEIDGDGGELPF